jgi:hypothetical protein
MAECPSLNNHPCYLKISTKVPVETSTEFSASHPLIQTLMFHLFVSGAYLLIANGIIVMKSFLGLRWDEL